MPDFLIEPMKGHSIRHPINGIKYVIHWAVKVFNHSANAWIFLQSFYTEQHAKNFVAALKKSIAKGDYSYLSLKL